MYKINSLWYSAEPPDGWFSMRLQEQIDIHYQQRYRHYIFHNCPRRRTMIDIGANIGIFARPAAQHFDKVICFEPVQKNFAVLEKNLESCSNVELHCLGISDHAHTGMFKMMTMKCGETQQVDHFEPEPGYESHTGDLVTLDQFAFDQVDWIKIDVEGFEMSVLQGSVRTIQQNRPWILLEDNGQQQQHQQWLNDLCGPYITADVKSKTNTIWIPQ